MPKGSKTKHSSSSKTVAGKANGSRVQTGGSGLAGKRGAGKRLRGLATVNPPAVLVQPDESESTNVPLKPGWAEKLGAAEARRELKATGREPHKAYAHSLETRAKMKAAQRARRAREHQEAR